MHRNTHTLTLLTTSTVRTRSQPNTQSNKRLMSPSWLPKNRRLSTVTALISRRAARSQLGAERATSFRNPQTKLGQRRPLVTWELPPVAAGTQGRGWRDSDSARLASKTCVIFIRCSVWVVQDASTILEVPTPSGTTSVSSKLLLFIIWLDSQRLRLRLWRLAVVAARVVHYSTISTALKMKRAALEHHQD